MKAVHVTPTRNIESILANGILRSPPILDQYNEVMSRDYDDYDPGKGLVFGFTTDHTERWIRHFAYWKVWGNPRNIAIGKYWLEKWDDLLEIGPSAFSNIEYKDEHLTAILIDIPDLNFYGWYLHQQSHTMNPHWADMEERYEHNDKPLVLINYDVPPKYIKNIIGTAETTLTKAGKVDILLNMKRKSI